MPKTDYKTLEIRALDMLEFFVRTSGSRRPAILSFEDLSVECGLTLNQTHYMVSYLSEFGYIKVESRFAANGGQLENAYRVMSPGKRALEDQQLSICTALTKRRRKRG